MLASINTYPWAGEIKRWDDAWIFSAGRRSEVHPRVLSPRRDWQGAERRDKYTGEGRGGGHIHPSPAYLDRPSKKFNHGTELNKHILNSSDTGELSTGRGGPARLRGKDGDEDSNREGRDRVNERHTNSGLPCSRDNDRDRGRERGSERDREHTQTQMPSKEYNIHVQKPSKQCIEMNKHIMRISDARELCDFISTHADHVCGHSFPPSPEKAEGNPSQSTGAGITNTRGVYSAQHARFWSPRNCQHSTHYGEAEVQSDRPSSVGAEAAGGAGGDDIRGVQLAGYCKHAVGVCDDGDKAGGADDGAAGAAGGGDIKGVQLAGCCKHAVGVCDDGDKAGGADDGAAGAAGGGDIRGVQLAGGCKHVFGYLFLLHTVQLFSPVVLFLVFQFAVNGF
jgi:hypothetical protein